ncbi:MAG TPA: HipA domain-containing protein [Solirubrobacterales bacterium]|nr:HipA domain-containing protein [Solirubrobacterales bacterium]
MGLDVYLYGERVGRLAPVGRGKDYEFSYSQNALERHGRGIALLSNSLPTSEEPFSPDTSRAYVEGLLPQGARRLRLASELAIAPDDGYAMIAALGADCIGGASFQPPSELPPCPAGARPSWTTDDELEELVAGPPGRLLDPARPQRMRSTVPGARHKLSLARPHAGGRWAWPDADLASTHIVKPESGEHPEMVVNEMFCTSVLAEAGLLVPPTWIEQIAGHSCLVSQRFDRTMGGPELGRIHQESFCQALSFASGVDDEHEDAEGPAFAEAAGLLRAVGAEDRVLDLIAVALCNYIVGNGDCHGENLALIVTPTGSLLAPHYDIASTAVYEDPTHVGMVVADDYDETVYLLELAEICEEAKVDFERCRQVAASVSAKMAVALEAVGARALRDGWHAPVIDAIVELAGQRAVELGYEVQY